MKCSLDEIGSRPGTRGDLSILIVGIVLAVLTEAIASTVLALGRADIVGDTAATPDEFAWLDFGYAAPKMIGFLIAAYLMKRMHFRLLLAGTTLSMGATSAMTLLTNDLDALILLRVLQGLCGGILLVVGQTIVFVAYPRQWQPALQTIFAISAVVAPATIAPALQGWLVDNRSWTWIFFCNVPLSLTSAGLLLAGTASVPFKTARGPFDWPGVLLVSLALWCFTYLFSQGPRWIWFQEPRIVFLALAGTGAVVCLVFQQAFAGSARLIDLAPFRSNDFQFAFMVSFVAGAALFGSAYLIPTFAVSILAFTPTEAGFLLLPSSTLFIGSLTLAAFLIQLRGVSPFATVPFGIVLIMIGMWMLSGSTGESGTVDMRAALLLRGLGLGFLFLSITLIAFSRLNAEHLPSAIGMFNTGRQLGGLIGVASLQTLIDQGVAANNTILSSKIVASDPTVATRLAEIAGSLAVRGVDIAIANRAAINLLNRRLMHQSMVIAFDTAFNAVALMFVFAAPILIAIKIGLTRRTNRRLQSIVRPET